MFTNIFLDSNKMRTALELADQLSLSLRENLELLSYEDNEVTFLTESKAVIQGTIDTKNKIFDNIVIEDASIFEDSEAFDEVVTSKIRVLTVNLLENSNELQNSFEEILNTWKTRSRFDRIYERLQEKSYKLSEQADLLTQSEFDNLQEIRPQLVSFIKENREELVKVSEVFNSVILSNVISTALNLPQISYESLAEGPYLFRNQNFESVYEVICRQELIKKELLESKKNFETMWVTDKVADLVSLIFEDNQDIVEAALIEAIMENPYFALANKTKLTHLFENAMSLNESVKDTDIRKFTSKIFEMKKPIKEELISVLNTKYGVNVQNLKVSPTFSDLAKTQRVIFETLSRLSPRKSVLKSTLKEFASILGQKAGVDCIDLNEWLIELFEESELVDLLSETNLLGYMDFSKVAQDLTKISHVLSMIQQKAGLGDGMNPNMGSLGNVSPGVENPMGMGLEDNPMNPAAEDGPYDADGSQAFSAEEDGGEEDDVPGDNGISPEEAAMGADAEAEEEFAEEPGMGGEEEDEPAPEDISRDELVGSLADLESLIDDLKSELGASEEEEGFGDEEGGEEFEDEEEEDPNIEINGGDGDDEIHVDDDSHNEEDEGDNETDDEAYEEDEEEEEDEFPPKKR